MSAYVFLDRDGTLTEDRGYTFRVEDYRLLPGVVEGLQRLTALGFRLAIVTNQSGIARGRFGPQDFERFQKHLVDDLAAQGIAIDASYHCPHHPDEGCGCRKPSPALLERARDELGADLARSWMIGDHAGDVALATRAGLAGAVLVLSGRGRDEAATVDPAVPRAEDLSAAAEAIASASR